MPTPSTQYKISLQAQNETYYKVNNQLMAQSRKTRDEKAAIAAASAAKDKEIKALKAALEVESAKSEGLKMDLEVERQLREEEEAG
jgi:hypothetical protein